MPIPALAAIAARRAALRAATNKKGGTPDNRPQLTSVEGIAMLFTALAIDFFSVIILLFDFLFAAIGAPGLGEFLRPIVSLFATIVLGGWMFKRSGGSLMQFIKRRGPLMGLEYIPIAGDVPWWTVNVFMFLKK